MYDVRGMRAVFGIPGSAIIRLTTAVEICRTLGPIKGKTSWILHLSPRNMWAFTGYLNTISQTLLKMSSAFSHHEWLRGKHHFGIGALEACVHTPLFVWNSPLSDIPFLFILTRSPFFTGVHLMAFATAGVILTKSMHQLNSFHHHNKTPWLSFQQNSTCRSSHQARKQVYRPGERRPGITNPAEFFPCLSGPIARKIFALVNSSFNAASELLYVSMWR